MVTWDQECSSKLTLTTSLHDNSPHKDDHKYNPSFTHIWCRTCKYIGNPNAPPYQHVTNYIGNPNSPPYNTTR